MKQSSERTSSSRRSCAGRLRAALSRGFETTEIDPAIGLCGPPPVGGVRAVKTDPRLQDETVIASGGRRSEAAYLRGKREVGPHRPSLPDRHRTLDVNFGVV